MRKKARETRAFNLRIKRFEIYHEWNVGSWACIVSRLKVNLSLEFFLNVFTEFAKFSNKNNCHYSKRARTY